MNHYDASKMRLVIDGVEAPADAGISTLPSMRAWPAGASVTFDAMVADIEALREWAKSVRHPIRIDAPSEVIAQLRRQLPPPDQRDPFDPFHTLPLERDDELPMRTVRVHYSDATSELVRLETRVTPRGDAEADRDA